MPIEVAIVSLLNGISSVTDLVGDRIAAAGIPQELARPNIAYQLIVARGMYSNSGPVGLKRATIQVSIYADDYVDAKGIAGAISAPADPGDDTPPGIDGYAGTIEGVLIHSLFIDDERDAPELSIDGQGTGIAGVILSLAIAYTG